MPKNTIERLVFKHTQKLNFLICNDTTCDFTVVSKIVVTYFDKKKFQGSRKKAEGQKNASQNFLEDDSFINY